VKYLWPIVTGKTLVDTSTVIHLAFWIFLGSCFAYAKAPIHRAMLGSFALAALWECFERSAEKKWPQVWLHPEGWLNAWVSDPLTAFLGVWFAYYLVSKQ
jgi:hypothetical protein